MCKLSVFLLAAAAAAQTNPIVAENQRPGTAEWRIARAANGRVEGYASAVSAAPGEAFDVQVNVSEPIAVSWQAFRLGYYQGLGGRLVASDGPTQIEPQPACPVDPSTALIECHWAPAFRITPGADWTTGQYLIKLSRADGYESYVPIVIREAKARAPLLFQASVTTWQAYNAWGGASLYANEEARTKFRGARAYRVSFDRPYLGDGSGQLQSYETWMLRWMEQRGYDVAYVTNVDLDAQPQLLLGRRMFLSVGHDEYWPVAERDAVERARDAGVSLGFFSANTAYWRIRLEPSSSGAARRIQTCYKDAALDPLGKTAEATTLFRSAPFARPENGLLGVMYETWTNFDGFPLIVGNPSHWMYEGTGVKAGETLSNIVGYEWDRLFDNGAAPAGLEVVAHGAGIGTIGNQVPSHTVVYHPRDDNFVFASGTIEWAWGLNRPDYADPRIQRITENLLARAGVPVDAFTPVPPLAAAADTGTAAAVRVVAGSGEPGYVDGPAASARFNVPAGVAASLGGTLFVSDARNHRVRVVRPDGEVSTLAGCGPSDVSLSGRYRDGTGADACFNLPTGIAWHISGAVFLSDTGNNCIRAIDPRTGRVTTYAGAAAAGDADAADPRAARFQNPRGLTIGPDWALYVADTGNNSIRRIGPSGVTTIARGLGAPTGVAAGPDGAIYTVETSPPRIGRIPLLKAGEPPQFSKWELVTAGAAGAPRLRPCEGLAWYDGQLVFSDTANFRVRSVNPAGAHEVRTLAGDGRFGAGAAQVVLPRGLAAFYPGLVVADSGNHRIIWVQP